MDGKNTGEFDTNDKSIQKTVEQRIKRGEKIRNREEKEKEWLQSHIKVKVEEKVFEVSDKFNVQKKTCKKVVKVTGNIRKKNYQ